MDREKLLIFWVVNFARIKSLLRTIYTMPALYAFVVAFLLSYLPKGFDPLPFLKTTFEGWLLGVFNGFFIAWTLVFTGFLQRDEKYEGLVAGDTQGISVTGNKVPAMYLVWVLVSGCFYGMEWLTAHTATNWLFIVAAFVTILPLFIGKSLQDQARRIMPLFAQLAILATTIYFLGWNTTIPSVVP